MRRIDALSAPGPLARSTFVEFPIQFKPDDPQMAFVRVQARGPWDAPDCVVVVTEQEVSGPASEEILFGVPVGGFSQAQPISENASPNAVYSTAPNMARQGAISTMVGTLLSVDLEGSYWIGYMSLFSPLNAITSGRIRVTPIYHTEEPLV